MSVRTGTGLKKTECYFSVLSIINEKLLSIDKKNTHSDEK